MFLDDKTAVRMTEKNDIRNVERFKKPAKLFCKVFNSIAVRMFR